METHTKQRAARLRLLVLLPVIGTFSLALALIIFSTKTFFYQQVEKENTAITQLIEHNFNEEITRNISEITNLLQLIEKNPEIKRAWQNQNRQQLIKATEEIYQAINTTFDITHFYFHTLDGKNFLRTHRPNHFGDYIDRSTLSTSRRTGQLSTGLEVGVFGQLVLRIVKPWVIDGKLIGYLELGKEIDQITQQLKAATSTDIVTLIDKQLIDKSIWQKSLGHKYDWEELDDWVITSSTLAVIPENLAILSGPKNRSTNFFHTLGEQTYISSYFTLTNLSRSDIGRMVVIQNISNTSKQLNKLLTDIAAIGGIVTLILFIGYFIYLGRIESHLAQVNRSLHQKIGEHKQSESKLRINRDELATINRELESYSYSIAHDLRAPLRSITSFSQIVLEDARGKLNNDETDSLNRVIAASLRMAELIDDILQLSRITREELSKNDVNLSKLVERCQHHLTSQEPGRNVEWDIQANVNVTADPQLLERAIENLTNNAWKYTAHTDNARITFGTFSKNNEMIYFVRDNGAGFDMNYAHKLFATFQRLHSPREFTGSGVGLAIVLRVIQRHHGRIWGEGEVGKGATFYFTLPNHSPAS